MTNAQMQRNADFVRLAVAWALVLAATIVALWPGLDGPFLFDDFGAIAALGNYGGVTDWESFKQFVFQGHAGPTGRPVSLVTFLIDATNWPADPWPFKRTNLVVHLLNGTLLGVLSFQVLRILDIDTSRARLAGFMSAGAWLLHPFLVSTTLYVVQRMAQLATLFVFAGLAGYLYGRVRVTKGGLGPYLVMSVSLGLGSVLAVLSKENGALLPLLAGVLELTILASNPRWRGTLHRGWVIAFLVLPSLALLTYLASKAAMPGFFEIKPPREFSLYERVLTQPRILADYLYHWFIPKLYTTGVFQDHFIKSTGLLTPVTTLLTLMLHGVLIALAVIRRQRWPLFALAVLFFYGGHLVESTVLNLELYFEHRNYLPAAFLFLPVTVFATRRLDTRIFMVAGCAVLLLLGSFTRFSATIWQDYSTIVAASAHKAPTSPRTQGQYAMSLFNAGRYEESLAVVDEALRSIPHRHDYLLLMRLNLLCAGGRLEIDEFQNAADQLSGMFYDPRLIHAYRKLVSAVVQKQCSAIELSELTRLFEMMLEVPANSDARSLGHSHLKFLVGYTAVFSSKRDLAVSSFLASLDSRPGASHAMVMAALLATGGYFDDALLVSELALEQIDADLQSMISGDRVSEAEIRAFQAIVREDIAAQQDADTRDPGE